MTKLNAYRCDRCQGWVEEQDNTDALIVLKGKTVGRYRRDLCPPCIEKLELGEPDQAPVTTTVVPQPRIRRPRFSPEEKAAKVKEGRRLLAEGVDLDAMLGKLEISPSSWNRWNSEFVSASLSASAADPDRATRAALGV
jgi:hypothetical protein